MPTFDVHQHLWPSELIDALAARREPPYLRDSTLVLADEGEFPLDRSEHRLDRRLATMDRDGTDIGVLSLQPTLGIEGLPAGEREPLRAAWHEGARRLIASGNGRIRAFASGACLDGFAGACVPAAAVLEGGSELEALLEQLASARRVLFVHPGSARPPPGAPAWWTGVVDYTAQMQAAYLAWLARDSEESARPRTLFAILAGGGPFQLERLRARGGDVRVEPDPEIFFDVSSYGSRSIEMCRSTFGVRQLVYGSDLPVVDPRPTLHAVRSLGDAVATMICDENATLLFG